MHEKAGRVLTTEGQSLSQSRSFPRFADKHRLRMSFVDPKKRTRELLAWLEGLVAVPGSYPNILSLFGCPREMIADVSASEQSVSIEIDDASPRPFQAYQPSPPRALTGAATTAPPLEINEGRREGPPN